MGLSVWRQYGLSTGAGFQTHPPATGLMQQIVTVQLFTRYNMIYSIHQINHYPVDKCWQNKLHYIYQIVIYLVHSVIHTWNNWGQILNWCIAMPFVQQPGLYCDRLSIHASLEKTTVPYVAYVSHEGFHSHNSSDTRIPVNWLPMVWQNVTCVSRH